jgi:RimJ/RimL family protein N-acetyltransferase
MASRAIVSDVTSSHDSGTWPLFGLAVRTSRLRLEYANDVHLQTLATFRHSRVLRPGQEPFEEDSSFYLAPPNSTWKALTGEWAARARTSPEWWHLSFAVIDQAEVVGQQNITGTNFLSLRTVNSFSFVSASHQGRGIGTEMRAAVLHLAFAGLGALRAESDAFADNAASLAISRSLGYRPNGTMLASRPSGPALMVRYLLERDEWEHSRRDDIEIDGLERCLPLLGLDGDEHIE